jgi:coenzyme PQQ precursor peptide PqqA
MKPALCKPRHPPQTAAQDEHPRGGHNGHLATGTQPNPGAFPMQWQTPTAIDFRFGFEISLYVANR